MDLSDIPIEKLPGIKKLQDLVSSYYEDRLIERVKKRGNVPKHIGIILDGNRRFAQERDMSIKKGHYLGADKLELVMNWASEIGIQHITVYAFSKENFERSPREVRYLMNLFFEKFSQVIEDGRIHENEIKVRAVGEIGSLPEEVAKVIKKAEEATKNYNEYSLNIAIGYGGRKEIVNAVKKICKGVERGNIDPDEVDEDLFDDNLYTADLPDPDLIIRTSGEERLSGFLLWQSAYSELYFCEAYWPDFDKINFLQAIYNYQGRERRYGK